MAARILATGTGKTKKSSAFDGISVKRQTAGRKAAKLIAAETTALALCTCECFGIKKNTSLAGNYSPSVTFPPPLRRR